MCSARAPLAACRSPWGSLRVIDCPFILALPLPPPPPRAVLLLAGVYSPVSDGQAMTISTLFRMSGNQAMGFHMYSSVLNDDPTSLVISASNVIDVFLATVFNSKNDSGIVVVSGGTQCGVITALAVGVCACVCLCLCVCVCGGGGGAAVRFGANNAVGR